MQRHISVIGLLFMSMSAIIGSGWLFAEDYAFSFAGSASMVSWVVGAALIMIVAFTFAEICTMIPIVGSSSRIPHFTHGAFTSYIFAWIVWISYLIYAPTEVQATIQYLAVHFPGLTASDTGALSTQGYVVALGALLIFSVANVFSIRWLVKANSFLTIIKIIIPTAVSVLILQHFFTSFDDIVHPKGQVFAPHGIHGILSAISIGGIIFAFNGFKLAAEMGGECKNPRVALPVAIIGSVVLCLLIYLLLQVAFLSTVSVAGDGGNSKLGPFAALALQHHLTTLVPLIYAGAIVAPLAAGLMYFSSASKSLYGMSKNGYLPGFFGILNVHGNPVYAIVVTFFVGGLVFFCFKGWDTMAAIITALFSLSYVVGPICLGTMRKQLPHMQRPFKLRAPHLWSITAFYACTMMLFWCGWGTVLRANIIIVIGLGTLFLLKLGNRKKRKVDLNLREGLWLCFYLMGVSIISFSSTYSSGLDFLNKTTSMILIFVLCVVCYFLALRFSLPAETIRERISEALEAEGSHGG